MSSPDLKVAETILAQLGGGRFIAMTGAHNFVGSSYSLTFRIPKAREGINGVRIELQGDDTYSVHFLRVRGAQWIKVEGLAGVYADMLRDVFSRATGLALSLGPTRRNGRHRRNPYDESLDRNTTIRRIREGLKRRSGHLWSVSGGRGTAWGWIHVQTPPKHGPRHGRSSGELSPGEVIALNRLLGYGPGDPGVHRQGWSIPASNAYYRDAVKRAETGKSDENPKPYWD